MTATIRTTAIALLFALTSHAKAAEMTVFGDFDDFFSPLSYTSATPHDPGFFFLFDAGVMGIPKFDPGVGMLTDITVSVDPLKPISFDIGGDFDAAQADTLSAFTSSVSLFGDFGVYYESGGIFTVMGDVFSISAGCGGAAMDPDGGCGDMAPAASDSAGPPFGPTSVFELFGSDSIFADVDMGDFVGPGEMVDSLLVGMFIETTAMFVNDNVSLSTLDVFYDIFAAGSGMDDVVAVTYTYTPVPLPAGILLLGPALGLIAGSRRLT